MRTLAAAVLLLTTGCATGLLDVTERIEALMRPYQGDVPGASLLVIRDGQTVVARSWGLSDVEARVSATPATNYRLASVTKQFTAASILLLAEDGKLTIDDPLRRWLSSLPAAADAVTIRHLLTHTSGLVDYEDVVSPDTSVPLRDADVLRLLESQNTTYFVPGSSYRYSNSGYALLALIVERASGQTFASFLRDRIFAPLGMSNTVAFEQGLSSVANRAYGYTEVDGKWTRTDQSMTSAVLGDGGIYSSIEDLAKWDAALYDDELLSAVSRKLAFTPHTPTNVKDVAYGFGWRITGDTFWHSGETIGFRNVIVRNTRRRLTVVVLTNRNEPPPYALAKEIAKLF
ncbi:MAG: beta-lactamase family protein [Thermoanaerobaculia bacterium]|nr:beta-lactamase family protein [Thermoanaerobaculia bacterium]